MQGRAYDPLKRAVDLLLGGGLLVASLPVQLVLGVLVRIRLGSPVLFRQARPGKDEVVFELVKFRTMRQPDPDRGLVTDEQRMTRFGAFLRSTSLDELPTLWNVVRGDMSLVGPRPLLVEYLGRYSEAQRCRHEVRPGITGLAQVNGRNAISWEEKFGLDAQYLRERSLGCDLKILGKTVMRVAHRHGISDGRTATMEEFYGSRISHDDGE